MSVLSGTDSTISAPAGALLHSGVPYFSRVPRPGSSRRVTYLMFSWPQSASQFAFHVTFAPRHQYFS